ncbi:MAG: aminotransferase class I/II-fold pyridoxal phosphate-dependent enzyme [Christensenellales bacterium]|jgi:8-amino-7-oxononanoate synthase
MDLFSKCERFTRVDEAKEKGVYPYFHMLESRQAAEVTMEGKRRIMLGSNNYLGLTTHPEVIEASVKAAEQFGSGCSGSRFLNGTLTLHVELEEALAEFLNKEACVTFSTGFQSNLGIISALCGRTDYIICDRENHASIYDACRLSYAKMLRYHHNDMDDLKSQLEKVPETSGILIVTDGVFSMGGDVCNLPKIVELAKAYGARVMVDDAHSLGVLGEGGRGTAEYFGLEDEVDVIMGTFSKSLASLGGYMASSRVVAEYVRHNSRPFIFSASITPASCAAAIAALGVLKREPQRVRRLESLSRYARQGYTKRGIAMRATDSPCDTPIVPLYTYEMEATLYAGKVLYDEGVYVNPVLPPATGANECLLRTSYMATHNEAVLDEAMDIIDAVFNRIGLKGQ